MSLFDVNVYLLTSNCARQLINTTAFGTAFFNALPENASLPDIIAVSLQEIAPIAESFLGASYLKPYFARIEESLQSAVLKRGTDTRYVLVHRANVGMTALMVFLREELAERVAWLETSLVGVGLWEMGNKGAAGLRLSFDVDGRGEEAVITLIAAHLTHMETAVKKRNQDWENIVRNLVFTRQKLSEASKFRFRKRSPEQETEPLLQNSKTQRPSQPVGLYAHPSTAFFFGDLNYRTRDRPPLSTEVISYPQPVDDPSDPRHITQWLAADQLNRERTAQRTLHHFREEPIDFPPTYKYSSTFQQARQIMESGLEPERWLWAKHRAPSWCDRILFWTSALSESSSSSKSGVTSVKYDALPIQPHSDHRPVALYAKVSLATFPSSSELVGDDAAPFPLNPAWAAVRASARRKEIMVGVAAWSVLTTEGRVCVVLPLVIAIVGWIVLSG